LLSAMRARIEPACAELSAHSLSPAVEAAACPSGSSASREVKMAARTV
jgi:hypothetical protein